MVGNPMETITQASL